MAVQGQGLKISKNYKNYSFYTTNYYFHTILVIVPAIVGGRFQFKTYAERSHLSQKIIKFIGKLYFYTTDCYFRIISAKITIFSRNNTNQIIKRFNQNDQFRVVSIETPGIYRSDTLPSTRNTIETYL